MKSIRRRTFSFQSDEIIPHVDALRFIINIDKDLTRFEKMRMSYVLVMFIFIGFVAVSMKRLQRSNTPSGKIEGTRNHDGNNGDIIIVMSPLVTFAPS